MSTFTPPKTRIPNRLHGHWQHLLRVTERNQSDFEIAESDYLRTQKELAASEFGISLLALIAQTPEVEGGINLVREPFQLASLAGENWERLKLVEPVTPKQLQKMEPCARQSEHCPACAKRTTQPMPTMRVLHYEHILVWPEDDVWRIRHLILCLACCTATDAKPPQETRQGPLDF